MAKKKSYKALSEPEFQRFEGKYIIPVMGATGAGKSTFINRLLDKEVAKVGRSLRSSTRELQAIDVPPERIKEGFPEWCSTHPGKKLVIVDTPGFDDTYIDDAEILKRIASWLAKTYGVDAKLAGIIYLHEIVADRYFGTRQKNFDVFIKMSGLNSCKSVVLGTTKWGKVPSEEIGKMEQRQNELRDQYWKEMTARGSTVQRVNEDSSSAWKLVKTVLMKGEEPLLQIQAELVDMEMSLPETDAAKFLRQDVKRRIESLKRNGATKEDVRAFVEEVAKLKPTFAIRLRSWFFKKKW